MRRHQHRWNNQLERWHQHRWNNQLVASASLEKSIGEMKSIGEVNRRGAVSAMNEHINRQLRATGRRPRLRSKLSSIQKESRSVFDMDTFHSWCQCIRFPNVFSLHTKHKLYFLMSQHPHHVERPHAYVQTSTIYVPADVETFTQRRF
jgi:hypothetical protein